MYQIIDHLEQKLKDFLKEKTPERTATDDTVKCLCAELVKLWLGTWPRGSCLGISIISSGKLSKLKCIHIYYTRIYIYIYIYIHVYIYIYIDIIYIYIDIIYIYIILYYIYILYVVICCNHQNNMLQCWMMSIHSASMRFDAFCIG